ncbi:MAG: hypothetical protein AAF960_11155 [Bacteroidota bacterium]
MKRLLFITITFLSAFSIFAQGYNVAGGIRMGTDWGVTAKYRFDKKMTAEAIIQSSASKNRDEVIITALVEKHNPLISKRFNFYTGAGLHKGWNNTVNAETTYQNPFGLTAIAGIEFNLGRTNVSWDFKPAFNLVGGERKMYTQSGISLRYVFEKRPLFNKKKKKKKGKNKKSFNWKFWEKWKK